MQDDNDDDDMAYGFPIPSRFYGEDYWDTTYPEAKKKQQDIARETPDDLVRVEDTEFGLGLFAQKRIRKGQKIADYEGVKIPSAVVDQAGFEYDKVVKLDKDWSFVGDIMPKGKPNFGVYANDPYGPEGHEARKRGQGKGLPKPNAEIGEEGGKVAIFAKREIASDDEILIDYTPEYWQDQPDYITLGLNDIIIYNRHNGRSDLTTDEYNQFVRASGRLEEHFRRWDIPYFDPSNGDVISHEGRLDLLHRQIRHARWEETRKRWPLKRRK